MGEEALEGSRLQVQQGGESMGEAAGQGPERRGLSAAAPSANPFSFGDSARCHPRPQGFYFPSLRVLACGEAYPWGPSGCYFDERLGPGPGCVCVGGGG